MATWTMALDVLRGPPPPWSAQSPPLPSAGSKGWHPPAWACSQGAERNGRRLATKEENMCGRSDNWLAKVDPVKAAQLAAYSQQARLNARLCWHQR